MDFENLSNTGHIPHTDHTPTMYWPHNDRVPTTYWLSIPTTFWPQTNCVPTTYWLHTDHVLATYRPHTDTAYWPHTDHKLTAYRPRLLTTYTDGINLFTITHGGILSPGYSSGYFPVAEHNVLERTERSIVTLSRTSPRRVISLKRVTSFTEEEDSTFLLALSSLEDLEEELFKTLSITMEISLVTHDSYKHKPG